MLKISQFKIFLSVLNSPKLRTKIGLCEIFFLVLKVFLLENFAHYFYSGLNPPIKVLN